jgi:predicted dehydrogenase
MDVGVGMDLAIHDIDLARFITESNIKKTNSVTREGTASYILDMDQSICSITASWLSPIRERSIKVTTQNAYYDMDLINGTVLENGKVIKVSGNALEAELLAFINYIKTDEPGDLALMDDAIKALEVVEN